MKKNYLVKAIYSTVIPILFLASCGKSYNPEELKNLAIQYSKTKNYDEAISTINQLIEINPNSSEAFLMNGFIKAHTNNYKLACEDFETASKLGDSVKAKYLIKIYCENELKDFPINDLEELNLFLEGVQKVKTGKLKQEKEDFDKVIQLNPQNYEAYYLRSGSKFYKYNDVQGALDDLNTAINIFPRHPNAFYLKANIFQAINQVDSAINNYTISIKLNPELADAYFYRGVLFIIKGMKNKGCEDLLKADSMNYPFAAEAIKENCK